jgi:p-aminobenzoyl-glutamate transporter AbgT
MNSQLQTILFKAKLNFIVLGAILLIAILGKFIAPELTNRIFETADQLISELVLIFVAITLGAFVPKFQWVVLGSIASFIGAVILIQIGAFSYPTFISTIENLAFKHILLWSLRTSFTYMCSIAKVRGEIGLPLLLAQYVRYALLIHHLYIYLDI